METTCKQAKDLQVNEMMYVRSHGFVKVTEVIYDKPKMEVRIKTEISNLNMINNHYDLITILK